VIDSLRLLVIQTMRGTVASPLNVLRQNETSFHTCSFFAAFATCVYAQEKVSVYFGDKVEYAACEGEIISYKYRGSHIRLENFKFQWFDLVEIKLTHPDKWKGNYLKILCNPSLPEGHVLRQEGKTIKFKADTNYVRDTTLKQGVVFKDGKMIVKPKKKEPVSLVMGLGAIILDKEFTKTPKIPDDHLVFAGTVSQIVLSRSDKFDYNPWLITFSVEEVISGDLSEKDFSIRIHSPTRFGLKKGKRYKVRTGLQGYGLKIDPIPPSQQQPPPRSK